MRSVLMLGVATATSLMGNSHNEAVIKVITFLESMSAKLEKEGEEQAVAYDKYACWSKNQADDKVYTIEKLKEKEAKLSALIDKLTSEIADHDAKVAQEKSTLAKNEEELKLANEHRADGQAEFQKAYDELTNAVKMVRAAIEAIKADARVSFVQFKAVKAMAESMGRTVADPQNNLEYDDKIQSSSKALVQVLMDLLKDFKSHKDDIWTENSSAKHAHDKQATQTKNEIQVLEATIADESKQSATKSSEKETAEGELLAAQTSRAELEAFLSALATAAKDHAVNFDSDSAARALEYKLISVAIKALKGVPASPAMLLQSKNEDDDTNEEETAEDDAEAEEEAAAIDNEESTSFVQLSAEQVKSKQVYKMLLQAAREIGSPALNQLAMRVKSVKVLGTSDDPFVKVRALISNLIERLIQQNKDEATHKAKCDEKMSAAITARDDAQSRIEEENAAIATNNQNIADFKDLIKSLKEAIASNNKALAEATAQRNSEKAIYEKNKAYYESFKAGLDAAIDALNSIGYSFIQQPTGETNMKAAEADSGIEHPRYEQSSAAGKSVI